MSGPNEELEKTKRDLDRMKQEYEALWGVSWEEQEQFYSIVGMGITFWGLMESSLIRVASKLLGTSNEKAGLVLYSIINIHVWLNILDELFSLEGRFAEYKSAFTAISAEIRRLNDTRVRLAHHFTRYDPDNPKPALRPSPYDTRIKSTKHNPLSHREILAFAQAVRTLNKQLIALDDAMSLLATSPGTPQTPPVPPPPTDAR